MMTVPREPSSLSYILRDSTTVLLDFDGPICDFFSGLRNPIGANRLRQLLISRGISLPPELRATEDAFDLFRAAPSIAPALTANVERELAALENEAAQSSMPTPHAAELIAACRASGRRVAIVSNTAVSAIEIYLVQHRLTDRVDVVVGRTSPDPNLLKPSPYLVVKAFEALNAKPSHAVLIGDQPSDMQAAHAAGIFGIGYANKPGKAARLTEAGANSIITSMEDPIRCINKIEELDHEVHGH